MSNNNDDTHAQKKRKQELSDYVDKEFPLKESDKGYAVIVDAIDSRFYVIPYDEVDGSLFFLWSCETECHEFSNLICQGSNEKCKDGAHHDVFDEKTHGTWDKYCMGEGHMTSRTSEGWPNIISSIYLVRTCKNLF